MPQSSILRKEHKIYHLVEQIVKAEVADRQLLFDLVAHIRPKKISDSTEASENLDILIGVLNKNEKLRRGLRDFLLQVFLERNSVRTFTELGILSGAGFIPETWRRITERILPPAYPPNGLMQDLYNAFPNINDHKWVEGIESSKWGMLLQVLDFKEPHLLQPGDPSLNQLLNTILVLSQRITAIGLEPEIVEKMPEIELFNSPFMVQSREISSYLDRFNKPDFEHTTQNADYKHILVMLSQCEEFIQLIRKNKSKFGTSLGLTYSLLRLSQNIHRLRIFLKLVHKTEEKFPFEDEVTLFKHLVWAENKKHSLRQHFSDNLRYLAFQITEHTGKKGERYITSSRKDYGKMLYSAMGGGLIVGFLTIFKAYFYGQALSLFGRAFFFSMNYSLGFILIHLTHSTLATKQPAMTASRVASSLDIKGSKEKSMKNLVEMLVRLSRTQFVAFLGNIILAFPVGFGISYLIGLAYGSPFVPEATALKMIGEIHPFSSLALFHAAIAGVYLSLSGIISGYYDNLNLYRQIPQRLRQHPFLKRIMPARWLVNFSNYIENNLGALAGNFFLGIFLGSTGTIGYILGLPLDIRHVTFASGNFGLAVASLQQPLALTTWAVTLIGIFLIGLVNFLVSFGLTTVMAMKSRNVTFKETRLLMKILFQRFLFTPLDFVRPPKTVTEELEMPPESTKKPLEKNTKKNKQL